MTKWQKNAEKSRIVKEERGGAKSVTKRFLARNDNGKRSRRRERRDSHRRKEARRDAET